MVFPVPLEIQDLWACLDNKVLPDELEALV